MKYSENKREIDFKRVWLFKSCRYKYTFQLKYWFLAILLQNNEFRTTRNESASLCLRVGCLFTKNIVNSYKSFDSTTDYKISLTEQASKHFFLTL